MYVDVPCLGVFLSIDLTLNSSRKSLVLACPQSLLRSAHHQAPTYFVLISAVLDVDSVPQQCLRSHGSANHAVRHFASL